MKTAICYFSRHHGNTLKVLEALGEENDITLIDVTGRAAVRLDEFDAVGFASGIYYGKFHETVPNFITQYLPAGRNVFFIYTCGMKRSGYTDTVREAAENRGARILGEFGCTGFDTFGPFKLIGGIKKGHPDDKEIQEAKDFYKSICG